MGSTPIYRQRGMTLIEIMVVLAIMGSLMAVLLGGGILKSNATRTREAGVEVMATLRGAYNLAAMSGKHHRVVFNLDDQIYHIEVCAGRQTLKRGDKEETVDPDDIEKLKEKLENPIGQDLSSELLQADSPEEATEAAAALEGIRVGSTRCVPALNTLSGQLAKKGNKHKMDTGRGIRIESIHVQHLNEPVDEGIVSVNFFPVGSAEKAVVLVENNDDDQFSVLVHGLTSRVEFKNGKIEAEDHMTLNAEGDEVEERGEDE